MKVVEVLEPGELQISERLMPFISQANEVIVKIKAAGICGSDMQVYNGENPFASYPRVLGHELAGEVYQVGADVKGLNIGNRVVIDNVISCGQCYACRSGRYNVCKNVKVLGVHVDGGYCEYLKVSADRVYKLSQDISWEDAATVEPYSIAAQVLSRGGLKEGESVLVCGAGPIGLVITQAAKRIEGVRVAVLDIVESRLEKAKECGADLVINSSKVDVIETIKQYTGGEGASLIIEATGNIKVLELCVSQLASQAGRIIVLGFLREYAGISPYDIMRRELDIIGSRLNNKKFPEAIKWLTNKEVDPSKIISHTFYFEEAGQAMQLIKQKPNEVCKVILKFYRETA